MEKFSALDASNENAKVSTKHIPEDLAFSILSKLPIKSLKRFGCCKKSWNNLFENPNFMSMYRNNFISNYDDSPILFRHHSGESTLYLLSGERFENKVKLDWPYAFQENSIHNLVLGSGSINGTLFLFQQLENKIGLWNPATEEIKVIPHSPVEFIPSNWYSLIFVHGFGYDHVSHDYKVIRCLCYYYFVDDNDDCEDVSWQNISPLPFWEIYKDDNKKFMWEIYSLRSNKWRKLGDDIPSWFRIIGSQVYMDGMCHWLGHTCDHEMCLVSFDLSNEVFFTTHMPSDKDEIRAEFDVMVQRDLVELNGSIGLISYQVHTTTFHISILGELGVKESWTKLYIVGPLPLIRYPIGMGQKGDIFFTNHDGEPVWFNLKTQMIEHLGLKPYCNFLGIYKKSILPIRGLNN